MTKNNSVKQEEKVGQIQKPLTIVRAEFVESIVNLINSSSLPMFIVEGIIKDLYEEIKIASQKQYESDKEWYESSIAKKNDIEIDKQ